MWKRCRLKNPEEYEDASSDPYIVFSIDPPPLLSCKVHAICAQSALCACNRSKESCWRIERTFDLTTMKGIFC